MTAELLGTVPQWITSAGIITFIGILLRYNIARENLNTQNKFDIRDHYAKEIAALRARIVEVEAHYRAMIKEVDEAHAECKRERDALHEELNLLKDELTGIKRQIARYSADKLVVLETSCGLVEEAQESRKAAKRMPEK